MNEHTCPVCGYDAELEFRPRDYQVCACCGTEFGYDDRVLTHEQLRAEWMARACRWFDVEEPKPFGWNAYDQLRKAEFVPRNSNAAVSATNTKSRQPAIQPTDGVIRVRIGTTPELQLV